MNLSLVTLVAAGVAGVLALAGVDAAGLEAIDFVAGGLVLGVVSEFLDRR